MNKSYEFIENKILYAAIIDEETYSGVGRPRKTDYIVIDVYKWLAESIGAPINPKLPYPDIIGAFAGINR